MTVERGRAIHSRSALVFPCFFRSGKIGRKKLVREEGAPANRQRCKPPERMLSYDAWFVAEVEKGIAAADRGNLIDSSKIRQMDRPPLSAQYSSISYEDWISY
jgi:hypothetical protein